MDWPERDAEAHFSELLETCLRDGPQIVTRQGAETAVLLSVEEWRRLQRGGKSSLKELLLEDAGRYDLPLPDRSLAHRRALPTLD